MAQDNDERFQSSQGTVPLEISRFLSHVNTFLCDFDHWWKTPLSEHYAAIGLIQVDLYTLKQKCEHLYLMLGQPLTILDTDFPVVWSAVEYLSTVQKSGGSPPSAALSEEVGHLRSLMDAMPSVLNQYLLIEDFQNALDPYDLPGVQATLSKWEQRFGVISAGLHQVKSLISNVQQLQARVNASTTTGAGPRGHPLLQRISHSRPHSPSLGPSQETGVDVTARLTSVENKLAQLENRLVGDGVTIGSFTFQSLDDVRLWCGRNLPTHWFGLFLDGVSIF
jgi:hypothetical protein